MALPFHGLSGYFRASNRPVPMVFVSPEDLHIPMGDASLVKKHVSDKGAINSFLSSIFLFVIHVVIPTTTELYTLPLTRTLAHVSPDFLPPSPNAVRW